MLSMYHILTVARYEMITLLRSWFFRIFAVASVVLLAVLNSLLFNAAVNTIPWAFRAVPSATPYFNLLLLNTIQAVIAVFLASDFIKRDLKLNTTEVIYMRSMSNGDYVLGKTIGVVSLFVAVNLLVLLVGAVFHAFFSQLPFRFIPYLQYFLIISVPTLFFITGLTLVIMSLLRSQAVTFIVLLGYIALSLFFLKGKADYLFDYMAFWLPLSYSDFVGFSHLPLVLMQRGIYFFLGLGFISLTILFIKRLPQSRAMRIAALLAAVVFFNAATLLTRSYIKIQRDKRQMRQEMREINRALAERPKVAVVRNDIELEQKQNEIAVRSRLLFRNNNNDRIAELIFSLNPGLKITNVKQDGKDLPFKRDHHVLFVTPPNSIQPGQIDSIEIFYRGTIDESACYLDVPDSVREKGKNVWLYKMSKNYGFVSSRYVLLTAECLWYPVAGCFLDPLSAAGRGRDFIDFRLTVKTNDDGMAPVSQGQGQKIAEKEYQFRSEVPLPRLSLVIGPYVKRSIRVDDVEYSLFTLPSHRYFLPYFQDLGDTLASLIRDAKNEFEENVQLPYPYSWFSVVEVPLHFHAFARPLSFTPDYIQPGQALIPENGVFLSRADFAMMKRIQERRTRRRNMPITDRELGTMMFRQFIQATFLNPAPPRMRFIRGAPPGQYSIFPNYYRFVNSFSSPQNPLLEPALEAYLNSQLTTASVFRYFFASGLGEEERANLALEKKSLLQMLRDPQSREIINPALKIKSDYLFNSIITRVGEEPLELFLKGFLQKNRYHVVPFDAFNAEVKKQFRIDLVPLFRSWATETKLPGFIIRNVQYYEVIENDRTRYQVRFQIMNPEPADGVVTLSFVSGGPGGFAGARGTQENIERVFGINANQAKEIGIVLDDRPRVMLINTLVSQNIPNKITKRFEDFKRRNAIPFDGERIIKDFQYKLPDEIIVDDEDDGFRVLTRTKESVLMRLFKIDKNRNKPEYVPIRFWRLPKMWEKTTHSGFYGKYVHSAYFIRKGDGNKKVAWNAKIQKSGQYDVYAYATNDFARMRRRGGRRGWVGQFHFFVHHDDGTEEVILDMKNAENGWNLLGTFYFSQGTATVLLTDETDERVVFADAIKWVKH